MTSSANVQTRVDPAIKEEAALVLQSIGLSISDVMRVMLTRIAQEKALPFELFRPNETTIAAMRQARAGGLKRFSSVAELMADVDENDRDDNAVSQGSEARAKGTAPSNRRRRRGQGA